MLKIRQNSPKNDVFSPIRCFGSLHRSFGRTDSAKNGRSFGRSFGFGRTLLGTKISKLATLMITLRYRKDDEIQCTEKCVYVQRSYVVAIFLCFHDLCGDVDSWKTLRGKPTHGRTKSGRRFFIFFAASYRHAQRNAL